VEKEEMAEVVAEKEVEAEAVAVGAPRIASGAYKVVAGVEDVADEIVAGVETMSVGSEEEEDEVIEDKIVVRLPGDRKRRIVDTGEGERVEVGESSLVRAIPVGPRSGEQSVVAGGRVPSRPSRSFTSRGRGGMGRGFGFGLEGYGYRGGERGRGGYYYLYRLRSFSLAGLGYFTHCM